MQYVDIKLLNRFHDYTTIEGTDGSIISPKVDHHAMREVRSPVWRVVTQQVWEEIIELSVNHTKPKKTITLTGWMG